MSADAKPLSRGRRIAFGGIAALWAMTTASVFALPKPPFDLEAWLWRHFPTGHADQYEFVNRLISPPLVVVVTTWFSLSIGLLVARRYTLLLINVFGPVVSGLMYVPTEDFRDPNWFTIGAVITIGCFVGMLVAGIWSLAKSSGQSTLPTEAVPANDTQSTYPQP